MEPPEVAVEVLGGDAAEASQEALDLAVAAVDRLDVHLNESNRRDRPAGIHPAHLSSKSVPYPSGVGPSFPDLPEALTCGDDRHSVLEMAEDALVVALSARIGNQERMPLPSAALPGCCSARGLRADRRGKRLKWLDTAGSELSAEQHAVSTLRRWNACTTEAWAQSTRQKLRVSLARSSMCPSLLRSCTSGS